MFSDRNEFLVNSPQLTYELWVCLSLCVVTTEIVYNSAQLRYKLR